MAGGHLLSAVTAAADTAPSPPSRNSPNIRADTGETIETTVPAYQSAPRVARRHRAVTITFASTYRSEVTLQGERGPARAAAGPPRPPPPAPPGGRGGAQPIQPLPPPAHPPGQEAGALPRLRPARGLPHRLPQAPPRTFTSRIGRYWRTGCEHIQHRRRGSAFPSSKRSCPQIRISTHLERRHSALTVRSSCAISQFEHINESMTKRLLNDPRSRDGLRNDARRQRSSSLATRQGVMLRHWTCHGSVDTTVGTQLARAGTLDLHG